MPRHYRGAGKVRSVKARRVKTGSRGRKGRLVTFQTTSPRSWGK